jgi:hypothetical protein
MTRRRGKRAGMSLKDMAQHAWFTATDDFAFPDGTDATAEFLFKAGLLAGVQMVAQAQRDGNRALDPALAEALEILDMEPPPNLD